MALALKKEALAVASGNKVFCYSYSGNVLKLTERPGEIRSLTVYQGRLLDSGDYDGIRDTQTGEVISGGRWRRIASWKYMTNDEQREKLYAAHDKDFGIFEFNPQRGKFYIRHSRNGRTNVLYGSELLVDAGDYVDFPGADDQRINFEIKDSQLGEILYGFGYEGCPITSFASSPDGRRHYFSQPSWVNVCLAPGYGSACNTQIIFDLKTDASQLINEFSKLVTMGSADSQIDMHKLRRAWERLEQSVPKDYFRDIPELCRDDAGNDQRLGTFLGSVYENGMRYIQEKEGFSSLAIADGWLFAGQMNGELVHPVKSLRDEGVHVMYDFKHPINAMCTIPEDLMDNGLRQSIVRSIQMKAVHARNRPAAMRRAA